MVHECRHDGLPCFGLSACYGHLKAAALNGGFGKLTDGEREFVGVLVTSEKVTNGWVSPIADLIDELGGMSPQDVHILERLAGMDAPPQERLEFLGCRQGLSRRQRLLVS